MRANHLAYTWKGISGYSFGYILITNNATLEDIRSSGRSVAIFGWRPEIFPKKCVLAENGLFPSFACDVQQPATNTLESYGIKVIDFRNALSKKEDMYFIIVLDAAYDIDEAKKLLLYAGIDDFGIVYGDYTKDFNGNKKLQTAFFDSINEIFNDISWLGNEQSLENLRLAALSGAGYWDVPYASIYRAYRRKTTGIRYLEIGPGIGTLSISLKKLLGNLKVTWIDIPETESRWNEINTISFERIIKKYDIDIQYNFIETDDFYGEYDIIVMAQVMEHLIFNPVNTFKKLHSLLSDTGNLFVSVPEETRRHNVASYREMPLPESMSETERKRRMAINGFGHFQEYSREEAMEIFAESGFECVGYKYSPPIHHYGLRKV